MQVQKYQFNSHIGDHEIVVETGTLALLAGGAVTLRSGESVLLATATGSRSVREGIDFFPLSVEFEEKLYAAGRIPGSFFRREGRPSEGAILTARLTDRPLRPLFPKGMRNEVQIIVTALASDGQNLLDVLAINAASAALTISDVPWDGPVGAVRVGYIDGGFVARRARAHQGCRCVHLGSGLFMRGETHVLTIATLGTPATAQTQLDTLHRRRQSATCITTTSRPSPPARPLPMRGPKRREIGHGALAERAWRP
jgi:polyribonucleotide nucleotidyltransferase